MRRLQLLCPAGLAAAALVVAPVAHAYVLESRWPTRTIPYHNTVRAYAKEVKAAAAAWNRSGVRVRWVAVPRSRARLVIRHNPRLAEIGFARFTVAGGGRGTIELRQGRWSGPPDPEDRMLVTRLVAHEMGHVLGLGHETRRCAIMRTLEPCSTPRERWRYTCRILEPDDVRGAVRQFGGRPRRPGRTVCDKEGPPPGITEVSVAPEPATGGPVFTWRNPSPLRNLGAVELMRRPAPACPTADSLTRPNVGEWRATFEVERGAAVQSGQEEDYRAEPTEFCYALIPVGRYGRPGTLVTIRYSDKPPG